MGCNLKKWEEGVITNGLFEIFIAQHSFHLILIDLFEHFTRLKKHVNQRERKYIY